MPIFVFSKWPEHGPAGLAILRPRQIGSLYSDVFEIFLVAKYIARLKLSSVLRTSKKRGQGDDQENRYCAVVIGGSGRQLPVAERTRFHL